MRLRAVQSTLGRRRTLAARCRGWCVSRYHARSIQYRRRPPALASCLLARLAFDAGEAGPRSPAGPGRCSIPASTASGPCLSIRPLAFAPTGCGCWRGRPQNSTEPTVKNSEGLPRPRQTPVEPGGRRQEDLRYRLSHLKRTKAESVGSEFGQFGRNSIAFKDSWLRSPRDLDPVRARNPKTLDLSV